MRNILTILLILAVTQMAGCAFGTRYVDLSYPPQKQVAVSSTETPPTFSGPRTQAVFLVVNDARETRDRIGNIRNTYGMDTASILTENNVEVWVHDAIVVELDRLGYQVLDPLSGRADASADRLTADVQKVNCDVYMVYDGEVTLRASLQRAGEEPAIAHYPVKVSSGLSWAGSGSAAGESLAQALQSAIREMLLDIGFTD